MGRLTAIKLRRLERNELQLAVARRAGINPGRLSLIENGHVEARPDELARIAKALKVPLEKLTPAAAA